MGREKQSIKGVIPLEEAYTKLRAIQNFLYEKSGGKAYVNSFEPANKPQKVYLEDGITVQTDVKYGEEYPNSYVDIYYKESEEKRPVFFYIHGGGFFMGHKCSGDPLGMGQGDMFPYFKKIIALGYNLVSVDYALSPDYQIPVQLIQVNDAIRFVLEQKETWNIDADRIVIGGGSAGADFSELYGWMLEDPDYAAEFGVQCAVNKEQVKGLILDEPAMNITEFNSADMYAMFEGWTGEDDVLNGKYAKLLDVPKHIHGTYTPSFLVASNKEGEPFFYDHCTELAKVLDDLGVFYDFVYPREEEGRFPHGYLMEFEKNEVAVAHLERELQFLKKCME